MNIFRNLKNTLTGFTINQRISMLFGVWIIISFSLPRYFDAHNSFDHSWMTAMAGSSSGKAFSYGPFSWIFLPDLGSFGLVKVFLRLLICFCICFPIIDQFIKYSGKKKAASLFGILLIMAAPYFKYDVLFYVSFWILILNVRNISKNYLFVYLVWSFVAPLYKFSYLPLALILSTALLIHSKTHWRWILTSSLFVLLGQFFFDSSFLAKVEYSLGYSEYMGSHQPNSQFITVVALIFIGVIFFILKKAINNILLIILMMSALFLQFKHGITLGSPEYAFYLFFLPCFFLLLNLEGKLNSIMIFLSVWMLPFYISNMGGVSGLLTKFCRSFFFKPNTPIDIHIDSTCASKMKRTILLDNFGDAIGSSCELSTFPSVQFYGFSPQSRVADLNKKYLFEKNPNELYLSTMTFGGRNFVSEISYMLEDLIKGYSLIKGDSLHILKKKSSAKTKILDCSSSEGPTKLVYLKMICSNVYDEIYLSLVGALYKYPEFNLNGDLSQQRVFYTSLKTGVHIYLGEPVDILRWWDSPGGVASVISRKPVIKLSHGGSFMSKRIEDGINKCLEVRYCQIKTREDL